MSKCKNKCSTPCPQGPRGFRGLPGILATYFDELDAPVDLPAAAPVSVASVSTGTAASPARFLIVTATFSAKSNDVPKFVDFFLRLGADNLLGGSELTFTIANLGQSGSITKRIAVGPGVQIVNLIAQANAAGVSIDPIGRPTRDHAALTVLESAA